MEPVVVCSVKTVVPLFDVSVELLIAGTVRLAVAVGDMLEVLISLLLLVAVIGVDILVGRMVELYPDVACDDVHAGDIFVVDVVDV